MATQQLILQTSSVGGVENKSRIHRSDDSLCFEAGFDMLLLGWWALNKQEFWYMAEAVTFAYDHNTFRLMQLYKRYGCRLELLGADAISSSLESSFFPFIAQPFDMNWFLETQNVSFSWQRLVLYVPTHASFEEVYSFSRLGEAYEKPMRSLGSTKEAYLLGRWGQEKLNQS